MTEKNTELIILTPSGLAMPALIAAAERASRRFVEFFTANIRNKNTRGAHRRKHRRLRRLSSLVRCRGPA